MAFRFWCWLGFHDWRWVRAWPSSPSGRRALIQQCRICTRIRRPRHVEVTG